MVGLDAAGKTTILYKLKLGEIVTTIPTIGMDICLLNHFVHVFNLNVSDSSLNTTSKFWTDTKHVNMFFL